MSASPATSSQLPPPPPRGEGCPLLPCAPPPPRGKSWSTSVFTDHSDGLWAYAWLRMEYLLSQFRVVDIVIIIFGEIVWCGDLMQHANGK
eukprot:1189564-Prorocentrum_minimum.AAC.11